MCLIDNLQETYEHKRAEHQAELQKKEEEMRQMFVVRVKKESELKNAEKEVRVMGGGGVANSRMPRKR